MEKGKTVIKTLPRPNAEMWNSFYVFALKRIDFEMEGLKRQRSQIISEMEELGKLYKKFATDKTVIGWALKTK